MPRVRLEILAILPILATSCADPEGVSSESPDSAPLTPDHLYRVPVRYDPYNLAPDTFLDVSPADVVFVDEVFFRWIGTDVDGDVVAFQYQLLATDEAWFLTGGVGGELLASVDPPSDSPAERWSPPALENARSFANLPDGWFELRARSVDDVGLPDPSPVVHRFRVFYDDVPPVPVIGAKADPGCGRLDGRTFHLFLVNGSDESRSGTTPRSWLQYRVQLRAQSPTLCLTHLADPFTEWRFFPDDGDAPIEIGSSPPTLYNDLFGTGCRWTFTLQVRDPAGNVAAAMCMIEQNL